MADAMTESSEWKVLPHGPVEKLSEQLLRVEAAIPKGPPITRVMAVARMADGRVVIHSAIALEPSAMAEIDALGPVAFLIVPNHWHRLDAARFAARYPDATVLCPPGSRKKVEEVVKVDGSFADFPADDRVRLEVLDGVGELEGVMIVTGDDGVSLVMNDALFNMPHRGGASGFVLRRVTGSSGGPRVSRLIRLFMIKDKRALRAHFERLAEIPRLQRILVAHHEVIDREPARVLREVAATLG
jgi:hypothetical protein